MTAAAHTRWGPFAPSLDDAELRCRLAVLRAFCDIFVREDHPIHQTLWRTERRVVHGDRGLIEEALQQFDALPALNIRHVLSAYTRHWRGPKPVKPQAEREADAAL